VVGVGAGYIGKNNTTIGCALGAWRLWPEEEESLKLWPSYQIATCIVLQIT